MKLPAIFKRSAVAGPSAAPVPQWTAPVGLYVGWGTQGPIYAYPQHQSSCWAHPAAVRRPAWG